MDRYHDEQLVDVLQARVCWGLDRESVHDDQLAEIADAAAGDARLAIGILRSAARMAENRDATRITDGILSEAADTPRVSIRKRALDSLTPHQRVVYDIVHEDGPLQPSVICDRYCNGVDDPRALRTVRSYLQKLEQYNLLSVSGVSTNRVYDVIESE